MDKYIIFDISIFVILIFGNIFIEDSDYLFTIIYTILTIYHIYISIYYFSENFSNNKNRIKYFIITSLLLYVFSYFIIFDTNPFFFIVLYYLFFPYFWKLILIVFIHSFFLSKFFKKKNEYKPIENNSDINENISLKENINNSLKISSNNSSQNYFFLFGIFNIILKSKKRFFIFLISLIYKYIINFSMIKRKS